MAESKEAVALELLMIVASAEGKRVPRSDFGDRPTKEWVLDTYRECLRAAGGTNWTSES